MQAKYRDKRQELFRRYFEISPNYSDYLERSPLNYQSKWRATEGAVSLTPQQTELVASFKRRMPVLVMSGVWCGDCSRQGPMLHAIELASTAIEVRWVESRENPELQEELRINGAEKVPVVVVMNEDFQEVQRFGDRHLSVYRRKAKSELGPACDTGLIPPSGAELSSELQEWIDFFERTQLMLRLAPAYRERYND